MFRAHPPEWEKSEIKGKGMEVGQPSIMSPTRRTFTENTMAFGGVPEGNMKAKEEEKVTGKGRDIEMRGGS